jgi:hypothetical protein
LDIFIYSFGYYSDFFDYGRLAISQSSVNEPGKKLKNGLNYINSDLPYLKVTKIYKKHFKK